jgi:predicted membrane GTPase involved in stress response
MASEALDSLYNLRTGTLYILERKYEGMVIETHLKVTMAVNPIKGKQLTNMRAADRTMLQLTLLNN